MRQFIIEHLSRELEALNWRIPVENVAQEPHFTADSIPSLPLAPSSRNRQVILQHY